MATTTPLQFPPVTDFINMCGYEFLSQLLFAEMRDCQWRWWRRHPAKRAVKRGEGGSGADEEEWELLPCDTHRYTPTPEDVGKRRLLLPRLPSLFHFELNR
jgi:hypothetical protein